MRLLNRIIKRCKGVVNGKNGYTLLEVAAVVAVTGTLGAVIIPIAVDKLNESKEVAARDDCQQIGTAISGFYKDTGFWPAAEADTGTNTTYYAVLRSGTTNDTTNDPSEESGINGSWNISGSNVDHLDNHLIVDNPGGTLNGTPNTTYLQDLKVNWKGPYAETFQKKDPWGSNYLVYVKAMHTSTTGTNKEYGWIISAGPDGKLDTGIKDSGIQGDDIGLVLFSAETGK